MNGGPSPPFITSVGTWTRAARSVGIEPSLPMMAAWFIGKGRGDGLHPAPEGRMPHPFNLGGGYPDVCHEESNRVTSAIGRQGFRKILGVLAPGLLSLRIFVVGGFVDGEFLDLAA